MLSEAGFAIDDEGTKRGLAWILATRVCEPVAMPSAVPTKSASAHGSCRISPVLISMRSLTPAAMKLERVFASLWAECVSGS